MKKLSIVAALLVTTAHAHAGNSISFEIDGHRVRIEAPKNCDQLSCLKISGFDAKDLNIKGFDFKGFNVKGFNSRRLDDDEDGTVKSDPPAPKPAVAPTVQATAPQPPAATAAPAPAPVATMRPQPAIRDDIGPAAPTVASNPAKPAPIATAPVQASTSPIGVWATEDDKGEVRIEQ